MPARRVLSMLLLLLAFWPRPARATVQLQVLFSNDAQSAFAAGARLFKKLVESGTHGGIQVQLLTDGKWHGTSQDELEMLHTVHRGDAAMCIVTTAPIANYNPLMEVLDTPYLFSSDAVANQVLDGTLGQMLLNSIQAQGLQGLAFYDAGFRIFSARKHLRSCQDLRGLRVRTLQSRTYERFLGLLGAIPVPAGSRSAYQMAAHGYVDAVDFSLPSFWYHSIYKVQKHVLETNHTWSAKMMVVNRNFFLSLPAPWQQVLRQAALQSRLTERKAFQEEEQKVRRLCLQQQVEITPLSATDERWIVHLTAPLYTDSVAHLPEGLRKSLPPHTP
ncbi:MAG: TRAP transporter substrate-binding protein [Candidatus Xenobia bacterium]